MRTLEQSILFPINGSDRWVPAPHPYDAFTELLVELSNYRETAPVAVINFNYDLCLDYAVTLAAHKINYGLQDSATEREGVKVYKVHGSLNWFRDESTGNVRAELVRPLSMKVYWDRLGLNQSAERPIDCMEVIFGPRKWGEAIYPEPIIVPPTLNKGWYQQQLRSVWRHASSALSTAENVFIIGYSLPPADQFFGHFTLSV